MTNKKQASLKRTLKKTAAIAAAATTTIAATLGGAVAVEKLTDETKIEQQATKEQTRYINEANQINAEAHTAFNHFGLKGMPMNRLPEVSIITTQSGETFITYPAQTNGISGMSKKSRDIYKAQEDGSLKPVDELPDMPDYKKEYLYKNGKYTVNTYEATILKDGTKRYGVVHSAEGDLGGKCTHMNYKNDKIVYVHNTYFDPKTGIESSRQEDGMQPATKVSVNGRESYVNGHQLNDAAQPALNAAIANRIQTNR